MEPRRRRLRSRGRRLRPGQRAVLERALPKLRLGLPEEEDAPLESQPGYAELLAALGFDPCGISELARRTRLTAAELSSMLLLLEMEGLVEALPGGRYCRLSKRSP